MHHPFIIFSALMLILIGSMFISNLTSISNMSKSGNVGVTAVANTNTLVQIQSDPNSWNTFEHEYYSFRYPYELTVDVYEDSEQKYVSLKLPDGSGYRNFIVYSYALTEYADLESSEPVDVFAHFYNKVGGDSIQGIKDHIFVEYQPIEGDFDARIVLDESWWQGGGPKTIFVKVKNSIATIVFVPMYGGYFEDDKNFQLKETILSGLSKEIIDSFQIK